MKTNDERCGVPSASGVERLALCPGSFQLESTLPTNPDSPDAASGTRIHAALAGEVYPDTLEEDEHITFEMCNSLERDVMLDGIVYREQRLWLGEAFSGKADLIIIDGHSAMALDHKTGRNEVAAAEGNLQLRALAVLIYQTYSEVTEVTVGIIQPWASPQVSLCRYDEAALVQARAELINVLAESNKPNAPRIPGEKQCRYCRGRFGACPEAMQTALTPPLSGIPAETTPDALAASLTGVRLAHFLELAAMQSNIIEACRDEAKRRLAEDPDSIPGWSLKPGAVQQVITDPARVFEKASANGVSVQEFLACVTVAKGKLEEAIGKSTRTNGKQREAVLDQVLAGCTEPKQNSPGLKRVKE